MKTLAAAPAFLAAGSKSLFGMTTSTPADPQKLVGVHFLRFLNTAQHWHRNVAKVYALPSELSDSPGVKELRDSEEAEKRGLGATYIATVNFASKEIVPGWRWDLQVSPDRSGYFITAQSMKEGGIAFSTTNQGLIFEGKPIAGVGNSLPHEYTPLAAVSGNGMSAISKRLASLTLLMFDCSLFQCSQCSTFPCCTDCTCQCMQGQVIGAKCWNCGCQGCIWCCDIY